MAVKTKVKSETALTQTTNKRPTGALVSRDRELGASIRKRPRLGRAPFTQDEASRFLSALEASPGLLSSLSKIMKSCK